jgi:hypothetical protein
LSFGTHRASVHDRRALAEGSRRDGQIATTLRRWSSSCCVR